MALLGLGSLAMVAAMCLYDPEAGSLLIWFKGNRLHGLAAGMFAALVIALPLLIIYRFVPLEARGGPVAVRLLPGILTTTLLGNLYEEVLFRGFLQGLFEKKARRAELEAGGRLRSGFWFRAFFSGPGGHQYRMAPPGLCHLGGDNRRNVTKSFRGNFSDLGPWPGHIPAGRRILT